MRGHGKLIEMRLQGSVPACVWIDTDGPNRLNPADYWHELDNRFAHIQTDVSEKASRLDLRCVIGLLCHIDGTDRARVDAMRDACIATGASRVIATLLEQLGQGESMSFRVVEVFDTEGVFTHQREVSHG